MQRHSPQRLTQICNCNFCLSGIALLRVKKQKEGAKKKKIKLWERWENRTCVGGKRPADRRDLLQTKCGNAAELWIQTWLCEEDLDPSFCGVKHTSCAYLRWSGLWCLWSWRFLLSIHSGLQKLDPTQKEKIAMDKSRGFFCQNCCSFKLRFLPLFPYAV